MGVMRDIVFYVNVSDGYTWQSVGREIAPNHLFNGHFQRAQRERSLLIIDNDNVDYYNVMTLNVLCEIVS